MTPTDADGPDQRELVRRGYDALSYRYRSADCAGAAVDPPYAGWLTRLTATLPGAAAVLDLGCGCGVPVARALAADGHTVTGVDFSEVQIERARELVPTATFVRADAVTVRFAAESFDAVVCLYALIHLPLVDQPALLDRVAGWLRPGGTLLATTGHTAWTGREDGWLDGSAPMWWSHADAQTYRRWLSAAGLIVDEETFVPEGDGGHTAFWARRPTTVDRP